jgi:SAM-dependent methyltransferase
VGPPQARGRRVLIEYDDIGVGYTATRRTDPRIAAAVLDALGDARTIVNVGAGTGSYEPAGREVIAIEPSATMLEQRPAGAAGAIQASAEALPLEDASVDAAMAVLSDHHWRDRRAGLAELRRVARGPVVLVNFDPGLADRFWLTAEYLPSFTELIPPPYRAAGAWERELTELLGPVEARVVPVPADCRDGFYHAFWRRPAAYLDARVRAAISVFARLPARDVDAAVRRLRDDLRSGAWESRHADLRKLHEVDLGLRVVVAGR